MTRLVCATHGHCFDGLASAALLTELLEREQRFSQVDYLACGYGPAAVTPRLDGDENALLDFRYHAVDDLSYYFDHHRTAFIGEAERDHFTRRAEADPVRFVWDPSSVSCARLIAKVARENWGYEYGPIHGDLLSWADKIDGAGFENAEEATDRTEPVMRLASVVERFGDSGFLKKAVPILRAEGLSALANARFIKDHYQTIAKYFQAYEKRVVESGRMVGRTVFIDLSDRTVQVVTKFFHYKAYPDALYSVMMTNVGSGLKLSVGYNPWQGAPLDVDIGAICARHGGGGHPVVGAVGFPLSQMELARSIAREIASELETPSLDPPISR